VATGSFEVLTGQSVERQALANVDVPAGYDPNSFPPLAVTVDVVLLSVRHGLLSVLLVERGEEPFQGFWALPGGFVRPEESLGDAAEREAAEETGLTTFVGHLEQLATFGDPGRDPRMRVVSVAFVALVSDKETPSAGSDAADARWWPIGDVGGEDGPQLAFDHGLILADGVERVRAKLEYTSLATQFVDEPFTMSDLRRVYEAVWGATQEPANFRRKVLATPGFVEPTGQTASTGLGRPADLYRRGESAILHPAMLRPSPITAEEFHMVGQTEPRPNDKKRGATR
jgi:8-oxo-dGTP diphosphatase